MALTPYFSCDNTDEHLEQVLRKIIVTDDNGNVGFRVFTEGENIIPATNVSGNGLVGNVPDGYMLEIAVIAETAGANVFINMGTVAGGTDLVNNQLIVANETTTIQLNYDPGNAFSAFISSPAWGGAILNIVLLIRQTQ